MIFHGCVTELLFNEFIETGFLDTMNRSKNSQILFEICKTFLDFYNVNATSPAIFVVYVKIHLTHPRRKNEVS